MTNLSEVYQQQLLLGIHEVSYLRVLTEIEGVLMLQYSVSVGSCDSYQALDFGDQTHM